MFKPFAERKNKAMKEVLINSKKKGPKIHYYMIRGGKDKTNITVLECGKIGGTTKKQGGEYIKTYGHYHVGNISETYTILQGEGILLLQKRRTDSHENPIDDEIEMFRAMTIKAGDKIFIEPELGHLLVNTGNIWLVTSDDSPVYLDDTDPAGMPGHADYEAVKKMCGFAYFIVEKNGIPTLIKNSKYKLVPEAKIEKL